MGSPTVSAGFLRARVVPHSCDSAGRTVDVIERVRLTVTSASARGFVGEVGVLESTDGLLLGEEGAAYAGAEVPQVNARAIMRTCSSGRRTRPLVSCIWRRRQPTAWRAADSRRHHRSWSTRESLVAVEAMRSEWLRVDERQGRFVRHRTVRPSGDRGGRGLRGVSGWPTRWPGRIPTR